MTNSGPGRPRQGWIADTRSVDLAVYSAIAQTPTPRLDRSLKRVSNAANYSRVWMSAAALLALIGGHPGRRAALRGLAAIAVTSPTVNIAAKRVWGRSRPVLVRDQRSARYVRMPVSHSFPSGHAASAFAFATGVGSVLPLAAVPFHAAAGLVAYSRVHAGVHYPGDVVVGSILGTVLAQLTTHVFDHRERMRFLAELGLASEPRARG